MSYVSKQPIRPEVFKLWFADQEAGAREGWWGGVRESFLKIFIKTHACFALTDCVYYLGPRAVPRNN